MDDLECSGPVLEQTLRELELINAWLGGNQITIDAMAQLLSHCPEKKEISIADLGCGGGDMLRTIDAWGKKNKRHLKLIGFDANPNIISFARKNLADYPHLQLQTMDVFSDDFQHQQFDIVIGTLFYHHFSNEQLANFFARLKQQVSIGFVINDIHRHWLAYYSIKLLTQGFSKSSMVKYDAPLSVLRAFTQKDLKTILEAANVQRYSMRWKWAFRWQVIVRSGM